MRSTGNRSRRSISWLLMAAVCLSVEFFLPADRSLAQAESPIRVGLFSLYHPQSLLIRPIGDGPSVVDVEGRKHSLRLASHTALDVRRKGDKLEVKFVGRGRQVSRLATQIVLASGVMGRAPAWRVTVDGGRLVRTLRGDLRIRLLDGAMQTVLITDRERLVARVVASEMSGINQLEALKAVAVVARTFALANGSRHQSEGFDFCDTTHCQWYQGEDRVGQRDRFSRLVRRAVWETKELVLSFDGLVRPIYFTSTCGGHTATPAMIWRQSEPSEGASDQPVVCQWCRRSKFYRWQRQAPKTAVLSAISELIGFTPSRWSELDLETTEQGFVQTVWIRSHERRAQVSGDVFRLRMGRQLGWNLILSNAFTIEDRGDRLIIRGHGWGHNVGLCLNGAAAQARAGRSYQQILGTYFPAAEIEKARRMSE